MVIPPFLTEVISDTPPSLYLALGMTEKEEKAQRRQLMNLHHCSELEAAFHVTRKLDRARGITAKEK